MINELLFQQVLDNRADMSNKGKRINTAVAVSRLRAAIGNLEIKGYPSDAVMNLMLEHSWRGIRESWLQGKLKPLNLTAHKTVSEATDSLLRSTRMPRAKNKYKAAEDVRKAGRDALEELRRITRRER